MKSYLPRNPRETDCEIARNASELLGLVRACHENYNVAYAAFVRGNYRERALLREIAKVYGDYYEEKRLPKTSWWHVRRMWPRATSAGLLTFTPQSQATDRDYVAQFAPFLSSATPPVLALHERYLVFSWIEDSVLVEVRGSPETSCTLLQITFIFPVPPGGVEWCARRHTNLPVYHYPAMFRRGAFHEFTIDVVHSENRVEIDGALGEPTAVEERLAGKILNSLGIARSELEHFL